MIRNLGKLFVTVCLLAVGGVVANAQVDGNAPVRASVPFAFSVGNTKLPAGEYQIRATDDQDKVLELSSVKGHPSILFDTENVEARGDHIANKTELVFDKVGDEYFLSQVWVSGSSIGSELPKSRMEKRLIDGGARPERHSIVGFMKRLKP